MNDPTKGASVRPGSGAMFDRIAPRYDLLNRLTSFGLDQGWRRRTVRSLGIGAGSHVLDLATGTADLALMLREYEHGARITGLDPSEGMLALGREKIAAAGAADAIVLESGSAEELPHPDDSFDAVMMAFGIRNVPDRVRALREMGRVTRPGGRIAILELTTPEGNLLAPLARLHLALVVPLLGRLLSGAEEYRYLRDSIGAFPRPAEFAETMRSAGLSIVECRGFTFGSATLFLAEPGGNEER